MLISCWLKSSFSNATFDMPSKIWWLTILTLTWERDIVRSYTCCRTYFHCFYFQWYFYGIILLIFNTLVSVKHKMSFYFNCLLLIMSTTYLIKEPTFNKVKVTVSGNCNGVNIFSFPSFSYSFFLAAPWVYLF